MQQDTIVASSDNINKNQDGFKIKASDDGNNDVDDHYFFLALKLLADMDGEDSI